MSVCQSALFVIYPRLFITRMPGARRPRDVRYDPYVSDRARLKLYNYLYSVKLYHSRDMNFLYTEYCTY